MPLRIAREGWSSVNTFADRIVPLLDSFRNRSVLSVISGRGATSHYCLVTAAFSSSNGIYIHTSVGVTLAVFTRWYWCRLWRQRRGTCQEEIWWTRYEGRKRASLLLQCSCDQWRKHCITEIALWWSQACVKATKSTLTCAVRTS